MWLKIINHKHEAGDVKKRILTEGLKIQFKK
jgi:hypothetical protein